MATKKCPECGSIVEQSLSICSNCGYPFEVDNNSASQENQQDQMAQDVNGEQSDAQYQSATNEQTSSNSQQTEEEAPKSQKVNAETNTGKTLNRIKIIRNCLFAGMIVFALFAVIFFGRAHYVRTVYYNSSYIAKNVYVGGDAYNYIINGTYFTGYSVTASGCMICALICGIGAAVFENKEKTSK